MPIGNSRLRLRISHTQTASRRSRVGGGVVGLVCSVYSLVAWVGRKEMILVSLSIEPPLAS